MLEKMYRPTENESYKANDRVARSSKKKMGLQCIKQFAWLACNFGFSSTFFFSFILSCRLLLYSLLLLVRSSIWMQ